MLCTSRKIQIARRGEEITQAHARAVHRLRKATTSQGLQFMQRSCFAAQDGYMEMLLSQTESIIQGALSRVTRPYIAFSGGKDSLVLAHLVSRVDSSIPMVYCDDELLYPEHVTYMEAAKERFGDRLRIVQGGGLHRQWFRPWKGGVEWWRPPHPGMEFLPWVSERNVSPGQLATRLGYNGAFLGLRRAESLRRAGILAASTGLEKLKGVWYANPIIDWSDSDVWDYIDEHGLDYCPVYDRLASIGISRHHARLGPLPLTPGEYLWKGWPQLYASLIRRYGQRWTKPTSRRPPKGVEMLDWLDIADVLRQTADLLINRRESKELRMTAKTLLEENLEYKRSAHGRHPGGRRRAYQGESQRGHRRPHMPGPWHISANRPAVAPQVRRRDSVTTEHARSHMRPRMALGFLDIIAD